MERLKFVVAHSLAQQNPRISLDGAMENFREFLVAGLSTSDADRLAVLCPSLAHQYLAQALVALWFASPMLVVVSHNRTSTWLNLW